MGGNNMGGDMGGNLGGNLEGNLGGDMGGNMMGGNMGEAVIGVEGLRKEYATTSESKKRESGCRQGGRVGGVKVAVRNLSLKVSAGEVLGLLGHNGAGKTTTMRMVIQEEGATKGRVKIGNEEIVSNQAEAFQQLGYCPQFDAVWQRVTIREHLALYATIRGVPTMRIPSLVKSYLVRLSLELKFYINPQYTEYTHDI